MIDTQSLHGKALPEQTYLLNLSQQKGCEPDHGRRNLVSLQERVGAWGRSTHVMSAAVLQKGLAGAGVPAGHHPNPWF